MSEGATGDSGPRVDLRRAYDEHLDFDFFGLADGSDFWNYGYWRYDTESHREACENLMNILLDFLPSKRGTILDVACGKGATTRHLLRSYPPEAITAINLSESQLGIARRNAPGCRFLQMDATRLDFDDESFDNVICVEAAVHFDTRQRFFHEAHRILRPGGHLVMSDVLMTPWAPTMPTGNYVPTLEDYESGLNSAGLWDVTLVDATRECWQSLASAVERHAWVQRTGRLGLRQFSAAVQWVRWMDAAIDHYVLVDCTKSSGRMSRARTLRRLS
jgi:ubiquinone/menaquinone biosynthesis C-methylase UbiE